jgi:hypothetical protein
MLATHFVSSIDFVNDEIMYICFFCLSLTSKIYFIILSCSCAKSISIFFVANSV